ncbi:intein-containing DNA gyrase subunit A [soil metagenome]
MLCLQTVAGVPVLQWLRLDEITPGTHVVIDRHPVTETNLLTNRDWQLAVLAGGFVAEGFVSEGRAGFNNTDAAYFNDVLEAYDAVVGGRRYVSARLLPSGKEIFELDIHDLSHLRQSPLVEMIGLRSARKRVPSFIWRGGPETKQAFLQALFEGDGSMGLGRRHSITIYYSTRSRRLALDVQQLLLEFGVVSTVTTRVATGEVRVHVNGRRNARIFAAKVGFLYTKQRILADRLAAIPATSCALSADHVPFVAAYVRDECEDDWLRRHDIDRVERWERDGETIMAAIRSPEVRAVIEPLVSTDWYYAAVESTTPAGVAPVYSIQVDSDDHAFVANGFVNHNTECRLAVLANQMLAGIDENTADFGDNYSGEFTEPTVLPARFPNLLVNGSQGIAVGMATNIPPHNLGEVIDATVHLIDNPGATPDELMKFVLGPDFPTGAYILGRSGILDAYRTGRGSIRVRARAEIVENRKGTFVIVSELPYQSSPNGILARIAELVTSRELEGIADINDESSGITTRLVVKLKRDANANVVLNNLYKLTPLQTSFGMNMVALVDGVPRTLDLAQALTAYVGHQIDVVTRRSRFRLDKAKKRAHIVEGLLKALDSIDAVIAAIRASDDKAAARVTLMAEPFEFSEIQAEHILDMTLSRLTRLGRSDLEDEMAKLREAIAELEAILGDDVRLRQVIKDELATVRSEFATPRRAEITFDPGDMSNLDLIDDEDLVVTLSVKGYVKSVSGDSFRTQARGGRGVAGAKLRDEDYVTQILATTAHSYLLFFSNLGRVYRLRAHEIPMKDRTARGTAIVNLLPLQPEERIQAVIDTRDYESHRFLFFATRQGQVKKTKFTEYDSSLRAGIIAINLRDGDELVRVIPTNGDDEVFLVTRKGTTIRFSEDDVRPMGRSAAGVRGMKMKSGDEVVSCDVARDDVAILMVTDAGYGKRTQLDRFNSQARGGQGVRGIRLTARKGSVVAAFMVGLDDEILLIASGGVVIKLPVREISSQGRDATGVRGMNLYDCHSVGAVALVLQADDVLSTDA